MTTANATAAIDAAIATNVEDIPQISEFDTNARIKFSLSPPNVTIARKQSLAGYRN